MGARTQQPVEFAAEHGSDVKQWPERTRRGKRVAGAAQHARSSPRVVTDTLDQRRLADAGLAAHEHKPTLTGGGLAQPVVEGSEMVFPLE